MHQNAQAIHDPFGEIPKKEEDTTSSLSQEVSADKEIERSEME